MDGPGRNEQMPRLWRASYIGRIDMQNAATSQITPAKSRTHVAESQ